MDLYDHIRLEYCRLCHEKPGQHKIANNKKLIQNIYQCVKLKVDDKYMQQLPPKLCDECQKSIKLFVVFKQHVRKVDKCLKRFLKNKKLKDNTHEKLKCELCPAEFIQKKIFKKHLDSHILNCTLDHKDLKQNLFCTTCKTFFTSVEECSSHKCTPKEEKEAENEKNEHEYEEVKEIVNMHSKIDLGIHEEYISVEQNYCKNHIFESEEHKDKKIKTLIEDDLNDISVSEEEYNEVKKNTKRNFICKWKGCSEVLRSAYMFKTHTLKHQGKRPFLCVTCGKSFTTKNSLTCHEKTHLEVKAYTCKICNLGFSVRSNLRVHEKKYHEGVRYYCSKCSKAFTHKDTLHRHESTHTGIKEFKCETCPKAFYTKRELAKHERYHQGLKLHKCAECYKTFFERHHLVVHLRIHTGERPYVCKVPDCGKAFIDSQKLKRHHKAKHAQT